MCSRSATEWWRWFPDNSGHGEACERWLEHGKKGKSYVFFSPSPGKKRFISSSDVAAHLQNASMLKLYSRCDCGAVAAQSTGEESSDSEDEEYHPETEEETGTSSAYDDTLVKAEMPRKAQTCAPMPKRYNMGSLQCFY